MIPSRRFFSVFIELTESGNQVLNCVEKIDSSVDNVQLQILRWRRDRNDKAVITVFRFQPERFQKQSGYSEDAHDEFPFLYSANMFYLFRSVEGGCGGRVARNTGQF